MPPVLDVSFGELMCRGPEEMFAGEFALWVISAMTSWSWSRKP